MFDEIGNHAANAFYLKHGHKMNEVDAENFA